MQRNINIKKENSPKTVIFTFLKHFKTDVYQYL